MAEIKRNKDLRKAIKKAYAYSNKTDAAVQEVNSLLKFEGFDYNEPHTSMCAGEEFIVEYMGKELFIKKAIVIMETRGYLIPEDFI